MGDLEVPTVGTGCAPVGGKVDFFGMRTISVVCPTFNSTDFIDQTLDTVWDQSRLPDELILSDDGSGDTTVEHLRKRIDQRGDGIRCQVLANPHRGPGAARNTGIRAATGDWIAFLDSDDIWTPEKLARMEAAIEAQPEANFFCHDELRVEKNGRTTPLIYGRRHRPDRPLPPQIYHANMFSTSAVVCRRELLLQHGLFDETLMSAQDYELWLRLSPHIQPVFIHEPLGQYREREGNITSGKLLRRMRNELKIAAMHRDMVGPHRMLIRVARILLSYTRQYAKARLGG